MIGADRPGRVGQRDRQASTPVGVPQRPRAGRRDEQHRGAGRRAGAARHGRRDAIATGSWFTAATAHVPGRRPRCRPRRAGSTCPGSGSGVWLGGAVVHGGRHPRPGAAGARTGLGRPGRLGGGRARTSHFDGHPTTVYVRAAESQVAAVRDGAGRGRPTPQAPERGRVSRPSDVLAAKRATDATLNGAAARPRRGGVAGRRGRRGQHDGDLGAGTPRRDRPAPCARRHPGPDPAQFLAESLLLSAPRRGRRRRCSASASPRCTPAPSDWAVVVPAWAMRRRAGRHAAHRRRSPASTRPSAPAACPRRRRSPRPEVIWSGRAGIAWPLHLPATLRSPGLPPRSP